MCIETEITLIVWDSGMGGPGANTTESVPIEAFDAVNCPQFEFDHNQITFMTKRENGDLADTSFARFVRSTISEKLDPRNGWNVGIRFQLNALMIPYWDEWVDELGSIDVIINGNILNELHPLMTCGAVGRNLNLKLNLELVAVLQQDGSFYSIKIEDMQLLPHVNGGDDDGHIEYRCFRFTPKVDFSGVGRFDFGKIQEWKLARVSLHAFVTGPECPFQAIASDSQLSEGNNFLNKKDIATDMNIMVKGGASISCHRYVLAAESPVMYRTLTGKFVEAETGQLKMLNNSEHDVMAFLSFLYQRDRTEKIGVDPKLALTLLEMADYYEVNWLEEKMTEFLVKVSIQRYSVDDALRLMRFANDGIIKDSLLKLRGVDALALRTDEEINKSDFFIDVFSTALARELFLRARKRF